MKKSVFTARKEQEKSPGRWGGRLPGAVIFALLFAALVLATSCNKEPEKKPAPEPAGETKARGEDPGKMIAKAGPGPEGETRAAVTGETREAKNQVPPPGGNVNNAGPENAEDKILLAKLDQDLPPVPERAKLGGPAAMTLLYSSGDFGELSSCG